MNPDWYKSRNLLITSVNEQIASVLSTLVTDDEQAKVTTDTLSNVWQLIRMLPFDISIPEIGVDPDGSIALDWAPTRTRMFSISISESDRLAYAWLLGSDHGNGVIYFKNGLPQWMLSLLLEITLDKLY